VIEPLVQRGAPARLVLGEAPVDAGDVVEALGGQGGPSCPVLRMSAG
jgi:hypothetical protein